MRKIILLFLTLTQISCYRQIAFKVQYQPETKYSQTIERTSHSDVKFLGFEKFIQKLNEMGVQNPTITDDTLKIESVLKTGKCIDGTNFPLTLEFVKTAGSDGKKYFPDGTLFYGHGSIGNMLTLDSIVSNDMDEEFKKILPQLMQNLFAQLTFPEKRVKVGESFSLESPLSIPIADMTIEMTITTTYKLLNIANGVADFDVSQVYAMKSAFTKYPIKATGSGKGKLLYDILNNYYINYQTDMEMKVTVELDNFDIGLDSKSRFIQTITIAKNQNANR